MQYQLIRFDNSDGNFTGNPKVLGTGERAQVKWNLDYLRKNGLPGFRYIMVKDKTAKAGN
jgi:hypothetical protein